MTIIEKIILALVAAGLLAVKLVALGILLKLASYPFLWAWGLL